VIDKVFIYVIASLVALLATAGFHIHNLNNAVTLKDKTILEQRDKITSFSKDMSALQGMVDEFQRIQNDLKVKQAKHDVDVASAMQQVDEVAKLNIEYSAQILAMKPKSTDDCKEADDLINSYILHYEAKK
jgi:hypothetical protein